MSLRICFVTPFAWSQPHEVNAHVDGAAKALRGRGHEVTILAPSSRVRDLLAGRRALQRGSDADVLAVGPSIPLSRRTNMGVPVAVRANLRLGRWHEPEHRHDVERSAQLQRGWIARHIGDNEGRVGAGTSSQLDHRLTHV